LKNIRASYLLVTAILCITCFPGWAGAGDRYGFELITSEKKSLKKGLSQNTIYSILQDNQGYMWFGTWDGLNKYDGYRFTIYNKENGLSNEVVNVLMETDNGTLWIGTENGLNALDRKTGSFKTYLHDPADSTSLSDNWINHIFQASENTLYVSTKKGLNILDINTGKFRRRMSRDAGDRRTKSNNIRYVTRHRGYLYVGTDFGLIRYDTKTNENVRYLHRPGDSRSLSSNRINIIFPADRENLWIGTEDGLNLMNHENGTFTVFRNDPDDESSISYNVITAIFKDNAGQTWIGTDGGGLNIYDPATKSFKRIQNRAGDPSSLNNDRVYSIAQDKIGNLWVGTFKGVNRLDRFTRNFNLYTHDPNNPNSVGNNLIWTFCQMSPGIFWIGTDAGISIFNREKQTFSHIKHNPDNDNGLSSNRIRNIIKDQSGKIWIATRDAGLNKFDPKTGRYSHFRPSIQHRQSLGNDFVISLYEDRFGTIWAGTFDGLNRIDPESNQIKLYRNDPDEPNSVPNNTIYHITEDSNGILWIATYDGLCRYNHKTDDFTVFRHDQDTANGYAANRFFYVFEDSQNDFWLGSRGGGLMKFDRKTGTFQQSFTTRDGLPNNVVYGIMEDDEGSLWMSTNWGISKFEKQNNTFINYDVTDGLQSNEFNALALYKCADGLMFFGGMNGFNMFHPDEIERNPNQPEMVISSFKKFNELQPGEIYNRDTIILMPGDNFFSFEFSTLDYSNPFKSNYSYILENFTENQTYVDGVRNFAEFTNVSPGTYFFHVIGSNSDGVWNKEGVVVTIIVQPHWYQTWFFRGALALVIIALVWLIFYLRYRSISKKQRFSTRMLQIENQLLEIQQQALRLQMNPHFIFNSLNSIQSFILSNDIDLAVNYLSRFSRLMRMIMVNSTESIIPLADEITAISHYMEIEKLRFDDKFNYTIQVADDIDEEFTGIPPMIIQPYIENAIIHGLLHKEAPGNIDIRFVMKRDFIQCTIQDDGIGRKRSAEIKQLSGLNQKSRGMMISKQRLDFFNKSTQDQFSVKVTDLKDPDGKPRGTKVELSVAYQEI
jgi:ligand-binding sensor domain-containing protein